MFAIPNIVFVEVYLNVLKQKYDSKLKNQIIIGVSIACAIIIITCVWCILSTSNDGVYFLDKNNVNGKESVKFIALILFD